MTETRFPTPEAAEAAFYEAFERRDLEAMMAVWAEDEQIECIHPMGPRLRGVARVRDSWRRIFADALPMKFLLSDATYSQGNLLAIHVLHEHIRTSRHQEDHPPVIATNIYQCTAAGWRMILHHASPSPPRRDETGAEPRRQSLH
jgi:ketosteroid isomerase-like protein